jgi:hypothetical protein
MITERTLRQWRKQALWNLRIRKHTPTTSIPGEEHSVDTLANDELDNRILRLTQELLDLHLLRKE